MSVRLRECCVASWRALVWACVAVCVLMPVLCACEKTGPDDSAPAIQEVGSEGETPGMLNDESAAVPDDSMAVEPAGSNSEDVEPMDPAPETGDADFSGQASPPVETP